MNMTFYAEEFLPRLNRAALGDRFPSLMTPRRTTVGFVLVLFIACGVVYAAQKSLKVDVDLVMVNVSVTEPENHSVSDLKAENFQIFEDKIEQQILYFSSEAAPLSLGIVFDI